MRILQISSATNFGGGERHFVDLCRGLAGKGHDVLVVIRPSAAWTEQLSFLPPENIIHLSLRNSLDVFSALNLVKIIREEKIDIVHAHLARDYAIVSLAVRIAKTARLVLTRHVFFRINPLHKWSFPKNTTFITPTSGGRRKLLQQHIVSPEQIHLIYCGINTQHFAEVSENIKRRALRGQLNLPEEKQLVGIAGEITEHKGQLDFVRAAAIVLKDLPETEFLIVGQDSSPQQSHQMRLLKLIKELNLQDKIHLLGFWEDVAPIYSLLNVFVSASHTEPFGLVITEASAAKVPVVATATDGATEIIIDGETGRLVPIENVEALGQAIVEFLGDTKMRQKFAEKAYQRIEKHFGLKEMIDKTEQLYRNVFATKSD